MAKQLEVKNSAMLDELTWQDRLWFWVKAHPRVAITEPLLLWTISFAYFAVLACKQYNWVFTSGDSGEFMAMAHYWSAPHLFGMPLYQALSHLLNILPWDLQVTMPVLLSALPASVTVALVYIIVNKMTGKPATAIVAALVLAGAAVFMSEAQVVKEYALATMLLTLSFYFYITERKALAVIAIGLGSAIHMMVVAVAVLWFLLEWRRWLRYIPLYALFGIAPYGLTLWELGNNSPPLIAGGGLSLSTINAYLGSSGIAGSLGIYQAPARLFIELRLLIVSLGLALVPLFIGLRKPWSNNTKMLLVAIVMPVWYYLSCLDPTTWTYLCFAMPFCAIAAGLGLTRMKLTHTRLVLIGAVILIAVNGYILNSTRLNTEQPIAAAYYQDIQSIPDSSVVIVHRGGFYGSGILYALSQGKNIVPVYYRYEDEKNILWWQYTDWVNKTYGLAGDSTQALAISAMSQGKKVYALIPEADPIAQQIYTENWAKVMTVEPYNDNFVKVTGMKDETVYSPNWQSSE